MSTLKGPHAAAFDQLRVELRDSRRSILGLIRTCEALLRELGGEDPYHHSIGCPCVHRSASACDCVQGRARAAIAKARGK